MGLGRFPAVEPFHAPWTAAGATLWEFGKLVDPSAVRCGDDIALYVATHKAIGAEDAVVEGHGHGIWRGTSSREFGRVYQWPERNARVLAHGVDFVVRAEDRVLVSVGGAFWQDSDVSLRAGGRARLYVTQTDSDANTCDTLYYCDGEPSDCCADPALYWEGTSEIDLGIEVEGGMGLDPCLTRCSPPRPPWLAWCEVYCGQGAPLPEEPAGKRDLSPYAPLRALPPRLRSF